MAAPRLTPDQIAQVSELVTQYISTQRDRYRSRANPLSAQQKAAMAGFVSPQLLESNTCSCCKGNELRTQTSTQC